ncbi:hypothetical protein, partial [Streptomyces sp. NPDC058461]|uniref:hypothetical protein n=1 Tax=Streptomyces sp. NPDC058461 TaxID=3346509 RepID=UPI003647832D
MHTYDVPRRQSYQPIPSARPAQDSHGGPSATPIYDALYAEYVKSFRSLPGDRSGEDELGFTAFGNIPHGGGSYVPPRPGTFSSSYSAYSAGAQSARLGQQSQSQWQRVGPLTQIAQMTQVGQLPQGGQPGGGHPYPASGTHHVPAALPPAPRRSC